MGGKFLKMLMVLMMMIVPAAIVAEAQGSDGGYGWAPGPPGWAPGPPGPGTSVKSVATLESRMEGWFQPGHGWDPPAPWAPGPKCLLGLNIDVLIGFVDYIMNPPPGYGGGGAEPGTGSTGDGEPPGWSHTNPGAGGTGP